ncbi:MAG: hypothetical protein NDI61_04600 [Bdellovibrionaceae bacterium]|nr:hypothetical protein [Pseudobdellovibrionaceae bacterium]
MTTLITTPMTAPMGTRSVRRFSTAFLLLAASLMTAPQAHAWGKRGHSVIAQTAAMIGADRKTENEFLRNHAFDLGYYANVPDIIWKKPETYKIESNNHFMDMEIFQRAFSAKAGDAVLLKPFELNRAEFEAKFPDVPVTAGRAYWRIRELMERLQKAKTELSKTDLTREKRHEHQATWLVVAGVIGHYVGDLGQPLHVTENYDGQMSEQKGVHAFFESDVVDSFAPGELEAEIGQQAARKAKTFFQAATGKSDLALLEELTTKSHKQLADLLKADKKIGRQSMSKARSAYRKLMVDRMVDASLYLAELWSRATGWTYDGEKFFTFVSTPEFIPPGPVTP